MTAYDDAEANRVATADVTIVVARNAHAPRFDETDYIGAVEPGTGAQEAWWTGWTIEGSL